MKTILLGRSSVVRAISGLAFALFAHGASAGVITQADFDNTAVLTDLNDLGIPGGNVAAPLTVGIYTFTTDDGQLRYALFSSSSSNDPQTGYALADNTDLGFINISIAPGANVTKFGFLVGLGGEAQHHRETVSFFDTNDVLLGSVDISRAGKFAFVGWDNTSGFTGSGYIGRALVTDTDLNSSVVAVDNLLAQAVPEPSTWAMMILGFAAIGFMVHRRNPKPALMAG